MLLKCVAGEDSWESLGLLEIKSINPKRYQHWIFIGRNWCWSSNTLATWHEEPIHRKRLRGQDERGQQRARWLDAITDSTDMSIVKDRKAWCVTVHGSQRVGHDLVTQQQYLMPFIFGIYFYFFVSLVVLGLSCSMQDLWPSLWHSESTVQACRIFSCSMWYSSPTRDWTWAPCMGRMES